MQDGYVQIVRTIIDTATGLHPVRDPRAFACDGRTTPSSRSSVRASTTRLWTACSGWGWIRADPQDLAFQPSASGIQ
jgi:hypothetical protein